MREENDRRTLRHIQLLFAIFSIVTLAAGIIAYNFAAVELKKQLVTKCHTLAASAAAVIAEDSDGYAAFLEDMNMDTDYYRKTKTLMMKLKQVNVEHVTFVYTEARVDDDTMMYVIGGDDPSSPTYTGPGVQDSMTEANRIAYREQRTVLGSGFVKTKYGVRLSAYVPIIHKDSGEFLGLVGADVTRPQYNSIMRIFIFQTAVSIIAALTVIALCMRWLSGSVYHTIEKERYEAEFARGIITAGRDHYEKMNEQFNALRILKHDYKFHLNTALNMLRNGEIEKSDEYLRGLQTALQEPDASFFCDNPVINSLIADYARRCREADIELDASVSIPDGFSIPNYEMCIVLGNFLENAVEACNKLKTNRKIELVIKPQGEQLAIMVRNTFDGRVVKDGDRLISTKINGGIGLQSVKAVVGRYCESFVTEHDDQWFNAFVLWKKGER
jgi:sensor histidine kinase regulating citrate/malate metabolism